MDRYGGQWAIEDGLPTNPEAKCMATFGNTQGKGIDALGYCHGIAAHLIGLCELLMRCPPWMHTWGPVASELPVRQRLPGSRKVPLTCVGLTVSGFRTYE